MVQDYVSYKRNNVSYKRNKGEGERGRGIRERERVVFYETPPGGFVRKIKPKFITLT